jgi:hypothetical protein
MDIGKKTLAWLMLALMPLVVPAQSGPPEPEGLVNISWIVGSSDCASQTGTPFCLQPGDRIHLVRHPESDGSEFSLLQFLYEDGQRVYTFQTTSFDVPGDNGDPMKITARFDDRFACDGQGAEKEITVTRLSPHPTDPDKIAACVRELEGISDGIDLPQRLAACMKEHAIHWKIATTNSSCPMPMDPPEDGQGTGSDSGN